MKQKLAQTGQGQARDAAASYANLIDPAQVPDAMTVEILRSLATGKSNDDLALELHISRRTMYRMLKAVREMWRVDTTMEAVVVAARLGLI